MSEPLSHFEVMSAFQGEFQPRRKSKWYVFGLVLVALGMIMLPLVYLGMIGGLGFYIHYLIENEPTTSGGNEGLTHGLPLILSVALLIFMIKPIFAKRGTRPPEHTLDPDREPLLFDFVGHICDYTRSPHPKIIAVDCESNASASFRRGWLSLLSNDLRLTIGLPLVASLTTRELAGVLAHEFGHFSQRWAMRLSFIVRSINGWFARVVYERDSWDEQLERWSTRAGWLSILLLLIRLLVWLSRRVLWVLMVLGHAISCNMSRQMEYDADSYEVGVGGAQSFTTTMFKLAKLQGATHLAYQNLSNAWNEGRLGDNLPELIQSRMEDLPKEMEEQIREAMAEQRTGLFDTHPSTHDRVMAALKIGLPGVFIMRSDSRGLFSDWDGLAKDCTVRHYQVMHNLEVREDQLLDARRLAETEQEQKADFEAYRRVFQDFGRIERPIPLQESAFAEQDVVDPDSVVYDGREEFDAKLFELREAFHATEEAENKYLDAYRAKFFLRGGVGIRPKEFGLAGASVAHADNAMGRYSARYDDAMSRERALLRPFARRLRAAILLLRERPDLSPGDDITPERAECCVDFCEYVEAGRETIRKVVYNNMLLRIALMYVSQNQEVDERMARALDAVKNGAFGNVYALNGVFEGCEYPFQHAEEQMNAINYIVPRSQDIDREDWRQVCHYVHQAEQNLRFTYFRALGRLARVLEIAERSCGWEPLEAPPEEPKDEEEEFDF